MSCLKCKDKGYWKVNKTMVLPLGNIPTLVINQCDCAAGKNLRQKMRSKRR